MFAQVPVLRQHFSPLSHSLLLLLLMEGGCLGDIVPQELLPPLLVLHLQVVLTLVWQQGCYLAGVLLPLNFLPQVPLVILLGLDSHGTVMLGLNLPGTHHQFVCRELPLIWNQRGHCRVFRGLMTGLACLGRGGRALGVSDPPHDEMDGLVLEAEKLLAQRLASAWELVGGEESRGAYLVGGHDVFQTEVIGIQKPAAMNQPLVIVGGARV